MTKDGLMKTGEIPTTLFELTTLNVQLINENTLKLSPISDQDNGDIYFTRDLLQDYLQILNAICSNFSIHTLLWLPKERIMHKGIDWKTIHNMEELMELSQLLTKINYVSYMMPQTILMDLGIGAQDVAAEFFLSADCRIMDRSGHLIFDHTLKGLTPMGGSSILLDLLCNRSQARHWPLTAKAIDSVTLQSSGLLMESYSSPSGRHHMVVDLLERFSSQSPTARIQCKQALSGPILRTLEERMQQERAILRATLSTDDWMRFKKFGRGPYLDPQELQTRLRERREVPVV